MSGAYNGAQAIILREQTLAYCTHCISDCTTESTISLEQKSKASGILFYFSKGESFLLLKVAREVSFLLEKLAIVSQEQSANYDVVLDCVQCTIEGMTEARNNFLQLYKEAEEFVVSCEEIHPIERPQEQK